MDLVNEGAAFASRRSDAMAPGSSQIEHL